MKYQPDSDEIELIYIVRALWKRKVLIASGVLLIIALGLVVGFLRPKFYEVSAVVQPGSQPIIDQNGKIIEEKTIISPEVIKESILAGVYNEQIEKDLHLSLRNCRKFKVELPVSTSLVKISLVSSQPKEAVAILDQLIAIISRQVQAVLDLQSQQIQNQIKLIEVDNKGLEEHLQLINSQMVQASAEIEYLEKTRQRIITPSQDNAVAVLLYLNELHSQQAYLNDLRNKLENLQAQIRGASSRVEDLRLKVQEFKGAVVKKSPTVPGQPKGPTMYAIIALSFALGGVLMVFIALFMEYIERENSKPE